MNKYYKKWFLPLTLPAVLLFLLVILVPFVMGVFYSFTAWKGTFFLSGKTATNNPFEAFVGLQNYMDAFNNEKFQVAFGNTIKFTIIAVITINILALLLALMLTSIKKFAGFFRVVFFMPNLLGGLALGFIWQFIFEVVFSQVFFGADGLISVDFFTNMTHGGLKSIFALVILVAWQMVGYMMIIYVAGLNNISDDLYEAAQIDGAGAFTRFRVITLPMLMPAFTIVFFLTLANCFKLLDQNVALTNGAFGTRLLALQILKTPADMMLPNYGQAQAQAVIFFVLVAVITLIQVNVTKKKEVEL